MLPTAFKIATNARGTPVLAALVSPGVIPLKDYNPTRHFPYVTVLLLALNVGVFLLVQRPFDSTQREDIRFSYEYAAIPCEISTGQPLTISEINAGRCERGGEQPFFPAKGVYLAMLSSMFLHGGILHIAGNMLYLWVFGNNIEDRMGSVAFTLFYLASGLVATLAHVMADPSSTIPVVGASGAAAGVMGAYLVLFPDVRIRSLIIFFFILFRDLPAKLLLGFWFVSQFFISADSGVAWVAHVGGFVFGAAVAFVLRSRLRPSRVPDYPPDSWI